LGFVPLEFNLFALLVDDVVEIIKTPTLVCKPAPKNVFGFLLVLWSEM
jgi:hypothetical protein